MEAGRGAGRVDPGPGEPMRRLRRVILSATPVDVEQEIGERWAQGRTRERASEMESYGVCVSAREMQGRGSRPSVSLALTQTP